MTDAERLTAGVQPLLLWYREHARDLPWRREVTPYRVWVSEIMLQQTRAAAAADYFSRFIEALPDVQALADCPEERLLKLWQGLGYYSRARNLQRAAKIICTEHAGRFPDTYDVLLTLPGIGEYTAGAVASIAFGQRVPAVDGNVLRVLTRLLADERDIAQPKAKRALRGLVSDVIPGECPGTFNQALMELGALVCLPNGGPHCADCPWEGICLAHADGLTDRIPVKAPKKPRRIEHRTVFLIFYENRVALRKRPEKGLLAGLWELPNEQDCLLPPGEWGIRPAAVEEAGTGIHIFTHLEWHMTGTVIRAERDALPDGWVWADRADLRDRYPIPNAFSAFRGRIEGELAEH